MKKRLAIILASILLTTNKQEAYASPIQVPEDIKEISIDLGKRYNFCPELIQSICFKESSFRTYAENDGCIGIMQVSPVWHADRMKKLGVKDLFNARENMIVAVDYLSELKEQYEDIGIVLMVYNGDSSAGAVLEGTADISEYADNVLAVSAELERANGK